MMGNSAPGRGVRLRGRDIECTALDELVAAVQQGESRSLLLRGDAGMGKTALLEYLAGSAGDLMVLRAGGVESEMELAFASLHQLCAPLLGRLGRIPAPQRQALEIVFGLSTGSPPDRFLVGLAVLSLVSEAAEERPVLCLVDDAQWLDKASALTLAFVARRLLAEPVGLVFAARDAGRELGHVPSLEVDGLRAGDARALLRSTVGFPLDDRVRDRIIAETRGNPLALLELPRGLSATELAGGFGIMGSYALPARIEETFSQRLDDLPAAAQLVLLVAAAEPLGDPILLLRACDELGAPVSSVGPDTDGLLTFGERVIFHHPLVRSAVYRSAGAAQRRAAHLALAEATDRQVDPDRRAWHLAAAATGPDEEVAVELEQSAGRAQARGGMAAATAFLQRAVALTADPARRTDRALAAAESGLQAGAFDVALGLLAAAEVGPMDALQRARLELLRAEAAYAESRGRDAPALLLRAADTLEPLDLRLARETYLDAWSAALFAGQMASPVGLHDVSRAALAAGRPGGTSRPSDVLLEGFSLAFTDGRAAAAPLLEQAAADFAGGAASVEEILRWGWLATAAAVMVWDFGTCLATADRGVEVARESGALAVLAVGANVLAQALAIGGNFRAAALLIAEADAVTEATGTRVAPYGALVLAGLRGEEADGSALIDRTVAEAGAGGQGTAVQYARYAESVLLNGLGRYREALAAAREASDDTPELFVSAWSLSEVVEAATRCEDADAARRAHDRLLDATAASRTDWARGVRARARALLSRGEAADRYHREAVECLGRTRLRPDLARSHLLYGEWLRREGRRVDARAQLRTAHDQFTAIGMTAFAERARRELQATGEKVRRRTVETRDDLTAQELHVARLARDGLSNPEIGARLFLSPRTVEWHLRKVFTKLGVHSRRELAGALPSSESELVSVA